MKKILILSLLITSPIFSSSAFAKDSSLWLEIVQAAKEEQAKEDKGSKRAKTSEEVDPNGGTIILTPTEPGTTAEAPTDPIVEQETPAAEEPGTVDEGEDSPEYDIILDDDQPEGSFLDPKEVERPVKEKMSKKRDRKLHRKGRKGKKSRNR